MRTKRKRTEQRKFRRMRHKEVQPMKTELTTDDIHAAKQGRAIAKHCSQVIHAPRLNFTYRLDGFVVPSGKKHRKIG